VLPLGIDEARVPTDGEDRAARYNGKPPRGGGTTVHFGKREETWNCPAGRWPANVTHDGSPEVLEAFAAFGTKTSGKGEVGQGSGELIASNCYGAGRLSAIATCYGDSGTAARYFACCPPDDPEAIRRIFYAAKASRRERNAGLEGMPTPMKLRDDLTPEKRAWVLEELRKAGVSS
jgi:hypothetical protein